jgi:hypothetical protein
MGGAVLLVPSDVDVGGIGVDEGAVDVVAREG